MHLSTQMIYWVQNTNHEHPKVANRLGIHFLSNVYNTFDGIYLCSCEEDGTQANKIQSHQN